MKWINSTAGKMGKFHLMHYVDSNKFIRGSVSINEESGKIRWSVRTSSGPGRTLAHAKSVVEKSVSANN